MAHFRKFYSNSSALSYFIPPRTTIIGIVAGLLGRKRDEYYEDFSLDKCNISIASNMSVKKSIHKLNNLMIKRQRDLNGSSEHHSQTATEFIIPQNIRTGFLEYQIWIHHNSTKIMNELEKIFNIDFPSYHSLGISMALGTAFSLGWIESTEIVEGMDKGCGDVQSINSIIPVSRLKEIKVKEIRKDKYRLIKEEVPLEFDSERLITERGIGNMIINLEGNSIIAQVDSFVELEDGKSIMWME